MAAPVRCASVTGSTARTRGAGPARTPHAGPPRRRAACAGCPARASPGSSARVTGAWASPVRLSNTATSTRERGVALRVMLALARAQSPRGPTPRPHRARPPRPRRGDGVPHEPASACSASCSSARAEPEDAGGRRSRRASGFRPPSRIRAASASVSALGVASNSVARRRALRLVETQRAPGVATLVEQRHGSPEPALVARSQRACPLGPVRRREMVTRAALRARPAHRARA